MEWLEYHDDPVRLHSGGRSHWLVRGDLIFADEELREAVLNDWAQGLGFSARPREFVGIHSGGTDWAKAIAEKTRGRWRSLSPDILADVGRLLYPDRDGRDGAPEHPLIMVDDVVTTGSSLKLLPHANERLVMFDRRRRSERTGVIAWGEMYLPLLPE